MSYPKVALHEFCATQYGFTSKSGPQDAGMKYLRIMDTVPELIDWNSVPHAIDIPGDPDKYRLKIGDIVIARTGAGSAGKARYIRNVPEDAIFASFLVRLKVNPPNDARYIGYLIESPAFERWARASAGGTSRPSISAKVMASYEVPLPPPKEQRHIASFLSVFDHLIANNTRRIEILEEMARTLYQEWFVDLRYPGHERDTFVESELGPIAEGWDVVPLSDLVDTQHGYTESTRADPIGPKFLRGMDFNKAAYIDWSNVPYCPISASNFDRYRLRRGDVLVIRMADPGKVAIVETDLEAVFASYLIRLTPSDGLDPYYLYYFLQSSRYQGYISGASTGTTRKSASAGVITGIDMLIPPSELVTRFVSLVSDFRQMLNNLLRANSVLRESRDVLLQKLVSGEIDVNGLNVHQIA